MQMLDAAAAAVAGYIFEPAHHGTSTSALNAATQGFAEWNPMVSLKVLQAVPLISQGNF